MKTTFFENMPVRVGRTVLDNGLTVLTAETGSAFVHAEMVFRTGGVDDTNYSGLAHFIEHLIGKDGTRAQHSLRRALEAQNTDYNAMTGLTCTAFHFDGPVEECASMVNALFHLCFGRRFKKPEVEAERSVILAEYKERWIDHAVFRIRDKMLFKEKEPWTFHPIGNEEGIRSISAKNVNARLERDYRFGNATLIVCGGVKHEVLLEEVLRWPMGGVPGARRPLPPPPMRMVGAFDESVEEINESPRILFVWGIKDPFTVPHPRQTALSFLEDGIFRRLREELGLVYSIHNEFDVDQAICTIGAVTATDKFAEASTQMSEVIADLAMNGVPSDKLAARERRWRLGIRSDLESHIGPASFQEWVGILRAMWLRDDYGYYSHDARYVSRDELQEQFRQLATEERTIIRLHSQ